MTDDQLRKRFANLDLEFRELVVDATDDDHVSDEEGEDAFDKCFNEITLEASGVNVAALAGETAGIDTIFSKRFERAPAQAPKTTADDDLQKIARRLEPRIQEPVRIEEELTANGRVRKTFSARTGALIRVQILEPGEE